MLPPRLILDQRACSDTRGGPPSRPERIQGYEATHMIRKGQVRWAAAGDDLLRKVRFIDTLFELAA
jgi:hypothetical protein